MSSTQLMGIALSLVFIAIGAVIVGAVVQWLILTFGANVDRHVANVQAWVVGAIAFVVMAVVSIASWT